MKTLKRNNLGQFVFTTGAGKYKRKGHNGKNKIYSRFLWEMKYGIKQLLKYKKKG